MEKYTNKENLKVDIEMYDNDLYNDIWKIAINRKVNELLIVIHRNYGVSFGLKELEETKKYINDILCIETIYPTKDTINSTNDVSKNYINDINTLSNDSNIKNIKNIINNNCKDYNNIKILLKNKKRKVYDDNKRCCGRCWLLKDINGKRCSRKRVNGSKYCLSHSKNLIHGDYFEPINNLTKINFWKNGKV